MSAVTWRVPGRIEVLGKHTDYAGGEVLVCAIDRAVKATATLGGSAITAVSTASADPVTVVAGTDPGLPPGHWGRYVQTVVNRLTANFGPLAPCTLDVSSTLPLASGMSSSSALLCAVALALVEINGIAEREAWSRQLPNRLDIAGYVACIENGGSWGQLTGALGVGTFGGSEDHTAMLCGVPDHLSRFSFDPMTRLADLPLPPTMSFVVAVSGVPAEKTAGALEAYNRASLATREILDRWNHVASEPAISLAGAVRTGGSAAIEKLVGDELYLRDRLRQFVAESTVLVPRAAEALAVGDVAAFGAIATESQRRAELELGNQVPETAGLAAAALELGALAASSFGAGFGGSVWALVETGDAVEFADAWLATYVRAFPERTEAVTLVTRPAAPASRIES